MRSGRRIYNTAKWNLVLSRYSHQLENPNRTLADALLRGERYALARCITLAESQRADHMKQAELLVDYVAHNRQISKGYQGTSYSLRIGVAGPPGAGKSTFIENIGMKLIASDRGNRVAVIPVDPSSHISGGSILGDMTRMENLSKSDRTYVRASPTRGVLGGVAEHTSEVISLCESGNCL